MDLLFESKYACRVLRKSPGHTAMCVIIVALSLCVGIIALTLVYNLMYKPLDLTHSDRWVHLTRVGESGVSESGDSINSFHYQFIKDNSTVFETLGAMRAFSISRLQFGEAATRISSAEVTPHVFEASGLTAHLGRSLQRSDGRSDGQVAVISHSLWKSYFSGDPGIVGQTANFDERPVSIVGVMPPGTTFGLKHDVWIANQHWLANRPDASNIASITPVGILKPGISLSAAQTQISELTQQLKSQYPNYFSDDFDAALHPFKHFLLEGSTPIFLAIAVFSVIIVLLGAVNIANLLIARAIERRQEFAIRNCVGSSNFDLLRKSLSETGLICLLALLVSLPLTWLGTAGINFYLVSGGEAQGWIVPPDWLLRADGAALVIALCVLVVIGFLCGLGPVIRMRRLQISEVLSGNKGSGGHGSFRSTKILVGTQIIASFFLLIVSGSLLISILRIVNTDYGVETQNRYVVDLELPWVYDAPEQRAIALDSIESELMGNPDIARVSTVAGLPHTTRQLPYAIGDRELGQNGVYPKLQLAVYPPSAFELLEIDIVSGRGFDAGDTGNGSAVTIVDRSFAQAMWPNESPLGKQVQIPAGSGPWAKVVGVSEPVVPGMQFANFNRESTVYIPIDRLFANQVQVVLEVRTSVQVPEVFSWVRNAVAGVDGRIAVYGPRTLSQHLLGPTYGLQMIANVFVAFAVVAVVLALIGVFAVISRSVLQQTRSIGTRRAVGSSNKGVFGVYLKQGCTYLFSGVFVGGGAALIINGYLATFFTDLPQVTPLTAAAVVVVLGGMIAAASIVPTYRALRYEPGDALRYE